MLPRFNFVKTVAPYRSSKADDRSGREFFISYYCDFIVEGQMMPAAKESVMYLSIASLSGLERLYNRRVGKGALGSRSIPQS